MDFERKYGSLPIRLTRQEVKEAARLYHFRPEEEEQLWELAGALCGRAQANVYYGLHSPLEAEVILTLGAGVDVWLEELTRAGELFLAYGADCLASYLLRREYGEFAKLLRQQTGRYLKNLQFYGEQLPLADMRGAFSLAGQTEVTFNEAYVLRPMKSVVFRALLSEIPAECSSVCADCSSAGCRERLMEKQDSGNAGRKGRAAERAALAGSRQTGTPDEKKA